MKKIKLGTSEFCFPCWGDAAMAMAAKSGFEGIQITDGGGYLQPHPLNNGFVEYERFGLDLRRKDSFPLSDPWVQQEYIEAANKYGLEITGIYLYLLDYQGFVKFPGNTPQGQQCLETIQKAILAAHQMKISSVIVPATGMFGLGQHTYAYEKLKYAAKLGEEYGVEILAALDTGLARQTEIVDSLKGKLKLSFHTLNPLLHAVGEAPDMIRGLGTSRIAQFCIKDMLADREGFVTKETGKQALLGTGNGKVLESLAAMKEIGYTGWIISETPYYSAELNVNGDDYVSLAKKDVDMLKSALLK